MARRNEVQKARVVFTTRDWNPISFLIRRMLPRSAFFGSLSSHAVIDMGDGTAIEASMRFGVRHVPMDQVMHGVRVVAVREYLVADEERGYRWLLDQIGTRYDWSGAIGLVDPDREWQKPDAWYCYELVAAYLVKCGLDVFHRHGSISERELLALKPDLISTMGLNAQQLKETNQ